MCIFHVLSFQAGETIPGWTQDGDRSHYQFSVSTWDDLFPDWSYSIPHGTGFQIFSSNHRILSHCLGLNQSNPLLSLSR